jgi:hypothetical protein
MTCHPRIAMTVAVGAIIHATACGAAQRTFVSGNGSDTNPCSISAPCRGFAQTRTPIPTAIVARLSRYGPVTINKSVSIISPPGVYAGITVFSGDGVVVAGGGIKVVLRGLSINGQGGIAASSIRCHACRRALRNQQHDGGRHAIGFGGEIPLSIPSFATTAETASTRRQPAPTVLRTRIEQNQGEGIFFAPSFVGSTLSIIDAHVASNSFGIIVIPNSVATAVAVTGTTSAGNSETGIAMQTEGDAAITLEARNNTVVNNQRGITVIINTGSGSNSALLKDNLVARNSIVGIRSAGRA